MCCCAAESSLLVRGDTCSQNMQTAQVAFVGFTVQALVTRKGPVENLTDHLANPTGANFITSIGNIQNVLGQGTPSVEDAANAVATATS